MRVGPPAGRCDSQYKDGEICFAIIGDAENFASFSVDDCFESYFKEEVKEACQFNIKN